MNPVKANVLGGPTAVAWVHHRKLPMSDTLASLVVIMAIMALISKTGSGFVVLLLYVVVALMIPMSQFGFIFVIWNMEQEG